jgi:hypothetical protein
MEDLVGIYDDEITIPDPNKDDVKKSGDELTKHKQDTW